MRKLDLFAIIGFSLLQVSLVYLDLAGPVRVASGFLFVALWPGYSFLAAVYPPFRQEWGILRCLGLAVPVSLALSASLGLALDKLGLSVQPGANVLWAGLLICGLAVVALVRRQPDAAGAPHDSTQRRLGVIAGLLAASLVLGLLARGIERPTQTPFLSLYVLGADGQLADNPMAVEAGVPVEVMIGGRYEGQSPQDMRLVSSTGVDIPLRLEPGEEWQEPVHFTLPEPGLHQVTWGLYLPGADTPERAVQVWVRVG
jgi:uncharacterized membrane protein